MGGCIGMSAMAYRNRETNNSSRAWGSGLQVWRILGGVLIVLVIGLYVALLMQTLEFRSKPFPGYFLTDTVTVNAGLPSGGAVWHGREDGLMTGDFIRRLDGVVLSEDRLDFGEARRAHDALLRDKSIGERVTIGFERLESAGIDDALCGLPSDGVAQCEVTTTLSAFSDGDFLAYFILPYITGLIILAIGIFVWYLRGETAMGFLALVIALSSAVYTGGIFDAGSRQLILDVWLLSASIAGGGLLSLAISMPTPMTALRRRPWLGFAPLCLGVVAGLVLIWLRTGISNPWDAQLTQYATFLSILGLFGLFGFSLTYQRRQAVTLQLRDQNNTLLIGSSLMVVPSLLWLSNRFLLSSGTGLGITFESLMPLYIFPNVAIAYAVLHYRRLDTDRIISQGITYLLMVIALIVSNFLLVLGLNFIVQDTVDANHPLLNATLLFAMVALFIPIRNRLQERIDGIYFRKRRNYQEKQEAFANKLTSVTRYSDVASEFRRIVRETLDIEHIFIYLSMDETSDYEAYPDDPHNNTDVRFSPDGATIQALKASDELILLPRNEAWDGRLLPERQRLRLLNAMAVAPMMGTSRLNGFVVFGASRSGKARYDYEEVRFLNNLVGQLALATERSQVVDSLERRVRELDVLSQVGQAVNFTIEFDDLLELIFAQTSKLIDSQSFYIALYEESIAQLYFAFYLEDDERFEERENIRWALSDDVYSEIVRTGKALRLNDYVRDSALRGDIPNIPMRDVQAWMGVPLTAGRSTVGVIAIGKTGSGETYSEEAFKIFNDIGALAATSIEKARLFNETKIRERQLTVLNDISRQLVATESDVEKLLEIIMVSAVEILNAEAGSLLLTMEDGSGDLEFRVVIGGAGEELVGQRWAADKGVVGQVMQTGEPRIVNDAKQDPQHMQDKQDKVTVAKFSTDSLLAVPLRAKDTIIGGNYSGI